MLIQKRILVAFLVLVICGCVSSGVFLENSNYSVKQHRIAITSAFGLVREVSPNGRTVSSYYHDKNLKNIEVTGKTRTRYYTKAAILGSIRPFKLSVDVIIEARDPDTNQWTVVGSDEILAEKRAQVIKEQLNQSREESGTFDEEAPF